MDNKEQYKKLCEEDKSIPLFAQYWWMDAVCPTEQWNILLAREQGIITGALPYHFREKYGFCCIIQPQLTQYNSVWINPRDRDSNPAGSSDEKKIFKELIDQLEQLKLSFYQQCFHHNFTNWLPFYWRGFKQTTRYTYVIENIKNPDEVYNNFSPAKKRQIKKCRDILVTDRNMTAKEFYAHHKKSLEGHGAVIEYSYDLFACVFEAAQAREAGQIFSVKDAEGNIHACLFAVWDKHSAYNLLYSIDPRYASSGASTLIVWEAIKYLSDKTGCFDFEGSMIESVENSYRQFGTTRISYSLIEKYYSTLFKALFALKKR